MKNTPISPDNPPIEAVRTERIIDWPLLMERRPAMLAALGDPEFSYLLLPEVQRLLDAADRLPVRVAIALLWYTGARRSELIALRVEDVKLESRDYGYVRINKTAKKRGRIVPRVIELFDPWVIDVMRTYIGTAGLGQRDCLLPSRTSKRKPLDVGTVRRWLIELAAPLDLPIAVTPHTLRHSFAINALLQGQTVKTLQTWLGHADPRSTEVYARILSGNVGFRMQDIQYRL